MEKEGERGTRKEGERGEGGVRRVERANERAGVY